MDIMKSFGIHNMDLMENKKHDFYNMQQHQMNKIFSYLSKGKIYNEIVEGCPDMTEDEINAILWYFAKKGIRYIPSLS